MKQRAPAGTVAVASLAALADLPGIAGVGGVVAVVVASIGVITVACVASVVPVSRQAAPGLLLRNGRVLLFLMLRAAGGLTCL